MPEDRASLITAFAEGPHKLRQALQEVPPARLEARPHPKKWSPREIALHLCDTEISVAFRWKRALAEPGGPVLAFDQDRWVDTLAPWQDLDAALGAFAALRAEMTALLSRLPEDAWERVYVHPASGAVSVAEGLRRCVGHTEGHIAQIRALAGGPPVSRGSGAEPIA